MQFQNGCWTMYIHNIHRNIKIENNYIEMTVFTFMKIVIKLNIIIIKYNIVLYFTFRIIIIISFGYYICIYHNSGKTGNVKFFKWWYLGAER